MSIDSATRPPALRLIDRRERDPEFGMPGTGLYLNRPVVPANDSARDVETEPGVVAHWLGREEWVEDSRLDILRDPGAVIDHRDDDGISLSGVRGDAHVPAPPFVHGVERILDQVRPHLTQLAAERGHEWKIRRHVERDAHRLLT